MLIYKIKVFLSYLLGFNIIIIVTALLSIGSAGSVFG